MLALGMEEGEGPWAQAGCWDRHVQAAGGKCLSQLRIQAAATSGCEMEQILWPSPLCYFLSVFGIKKLDLYCTKHEKPVINPAAPGDRRRGEGPAGTNRLF